MEALAHAVSGALAEALGPLAHAVYLYGSLAAPPYQPDESDVNLLLIVANETSLHAARAAFLPLWATHGARLRRAPLVMTPAALARTLRLEPGLAVHLHQHAQRLHGTAELPPAPAPISPRDDLARLALALFQASSALVTGDAPAPLLALRRLARTTLRREIGGEETAVALFAQLQEQFQANLPPDPASEPEEEPAAAAPGLRAIYRRSAGQTILLFDHLAAERIYAIDWPALAAQLAAPGELLRVITVTQFRLALTHEQPIHLLFKRYDHQWGADPLADWEVTRAAVLRQAARQAARLLADAIPNSYLTRADDQLGDIIHDFQNHILNIHLEHEILRRLGYTQRFQAPRPLLDRTATPTRRIDAIVQHVEDWAAFYAAALDAAAA